MKAKIILSSAVICAFITAVICTFITAVMLHITAQRPMDAPPTPQPREAAIVLTPPPTVPVLTIKKLDTALKGQPSVAEAYPEIAHDPEAIRTIQLERLQEVFPDLKEIPEDWTKFNPQNLTVAPYADVKIPAQLVSTQTISGRTVNTYTNGFQGGYIVSAATPNEMVMITTVPAADIFTIKIKDSEVSVTTAPIADCGTSTNHDTNAINHTHTTDAQILGEFNQNTNTKEYAAQTGTTSYISKVAFFYANDTLTDFGNDPTSLETQYIAQLTAANIVLDNSDIPLQWQYLGAYLLPDFQLLTYEQLGVPPPETGIDANSYHYNGLEILKENATHIGIENQVAHNFAKSKIAEIGADQSVFVAPVAPDHSGIAGRANAGPVPFLARETAVRSDSDYITLTHEMGHNFGCFHDRETDGIPDSDTNYYYGYTHTGTIVLTSGTYLWNVETKIGTVMSYSPYYLPYFSSPLITFPANAPIPSDGTPATNGDTEFILGIAEGQPKAADNAKYMREVVKFMPRAPAPPVITEHPQNVTVTQGTSFTLTVTASGAGLAYRWHKTTNFGSEIPNLENSYLTKTAALVDSGTYYVIVSNNKGSVTSNMATVTVTEAVTAPTITRQPTNVTVNQGSSFTLTVTASGSNLSYQWYKNGSAVNGATSASYTKSAATGDAGSYYVRVTNSAGNVVSNTVTLTVTPSGGSSGGGSSSSGGGGGGGAPSLLLIGALGVAGLLKRLTGR
jgi:hypothetical protein